MARIPLRSLRRVPWQTLWAAAAWLYTQARHRLEHNLTPSERRDLRELMTKSRGRPTNLSASEQARMRRLVRKALTGRAD